MKNKKTDNNSLYPDFLVNIINDRINQYVAEYNNVPCALKNAIKYSLQNGGKRFRPVLCALTAKSLGKDCELVLPAACAIEFIHTYSLIHDDLPSIDNDDLRRGKPACHKKFGEDIAILTGDALFAEAFNIILRHQEANKDNLARVMLEISSASGADGMVAGQIVDVYYAGKKISGKKLEYMHSKKTGGLITASVRCGAILSGASEEYINRFGQYAENIGLAFQITDDLIDLESTTEKTGKSTGKDIMQEKNTFPSMYGIEKSRKIASEKVSCAIEIINNMDIERSWLIKIAKFLLQRKN
jgi:geranylgeranyl diphosphate synthase type II